MQSTPICQGWFSPLLARVLLQVKSLHISQPTVYCLTLHLHAADVAKLDVFTLFFLLQVFLQLNLALRAARQVELEPLLRRSIDCQRRPRQGLSRDRLGLLDLGVGYGAH